MVVARSPPGCTGGRRLSVRVTACELAHRCEDGPTLRAMDRGRPARRARVICVLTLTLVAAALAATTSSSAQSPVVDPTVPAARDGDPAVLTGSQFPGWSAPSNQTAKLPFTDLTQCPSFDEKCQHNH